MFKYITYCYLYIYSNYFIDFILGATDFSDLFSRIQGVNTITEYDQELMRGLAKDKEESESQKVLLESSQASLTTLQASQVAKQDAISALTRRAKETASLNALRWDSKNDSSKGLAVV